MILEFVAIRKMQVAEDTGVRGISNSGLLRLDFRFPQQRRMGGLLEGVRLNAKVKTTDVSTSINKSQ